MYYVRLHFLEKNVIVGIYKCWAISKGNGVVAIINYLFTIIVYLIVTRGFSFVTACNSLSSIHLFSNQL